MKTLIVSFVIWIFVVPVAVAVFFIFMFLAAHGPDLYFTVTPLALAFSVLTMVWGPFWLEPFSESQFPVVPKVSATHKFNSGETL
jgi:hypothetical protein